MTDIHVIEIDNDNVFLWVVWLHFVGTQDYHKVVQSVENVLNLHIVANLVDSKNNYWTVISAVPKGVNEPFFKILDGFILEFGYLRVIEFL